MKYKIKQRKYACVLAIFAFILVGCSEANKNSSIKPGKRWVDTSGNVINAHGGGVILHEGTYYWYGSAYRDVYEEGTTEIGVVVYSSKDLCNWTDEGVALACTDNAGDDIERGCIIERPKVIYNEKTKKFVMWFHLELKGQDYDAARTAVAVSDHVEGPYTYIKSLRPNANVYPINYGVYNQGYEFTGETTKGTKEWRDEIKKGLLVERDLKGGQMARDMTLFVDDDGKAYHIHSSEDNQTLHISELTDDYLDFTGVYTRVMPMGSNEAPALFKKGDVYYMMASGCTWWEPNAARMFRTKDILGEWEYLGNPCVGEGSEKTFYSQSAYVLPVVGKSCKYIYIGDRWDPKHLMESRHIWLPIDFDGDIPVIRWHDDWTL